MEADAEKAISIYHIEGRRSFRVVWLCEELQIPYKLIYQRGDILASLLAIRAANPIMPMAPVVVIDGHAVVESGAILDILLARSPLKTEMRPAVDTVDFIHHTQWMHFAEGTAQARMLAWRMVALALNRDVDELPEGYRFNLGKASDSTPSGPTAILEFLIGPRAIFDAIEGYLAAHRYFGGTRFTAADIMMHYQVRHAMLMSLIDLDDYPATKSWRQHVEQRTAFIRAERIAHPDGTDEHGLPVNSPPPFPLRRTR